LHKLKLKSSCSTFGPIYVVIFCALFLLIERPRSLRGAHFERAALEAPARVRASRSLAWVLPAGRPESYRKKGLNLGAICPLETPRRWRCVGAMHLDAFDWLPRAQLAAANLAARRSGALGCPFVHEAPRDDCHWLPLAWRRAHFGPEQKASRRVTCCI